MGNNKTVFFLIGILLIVLGPSMLAPYSMQVIYKENSHSFISSSFVTIFIGILCILANLEKDLKELKKITSNISWQDFDDYEKLRTRLKEDRRLLKILEKQAAAKLSEEITNALSFIKDGSLISIRAPQINRKIIPGLICKKIYESNVIKSLLCLTIENVFILIKPSYIVNIFPDLDVIDILNLEEPKMYFSGEVVRGDDKSQCFVNEILKVSEKNHLNQNYF